MLKKDYESKYERRSTLKVHHNTDNIKEKYKKKNMITILIRSLKEKHKGK